MNNKTVTRISIFATILLVSHSVLAGDVTYRKHIKPLWQKQCASCHDAKSPYLGEFLENKKKYKKLMKGPRMDSYPALIFFIGWPDAGAIMRRLDDGKNKSNGKPGNMYQYLGKTEKERQNNLALFKAWVGNRAWKLNRWNTRKDMPGITKKELSRIKVKY